MKNVLKINAALAAILLTGCATQGNYQQAFSDKEQINGSSQIVAAQADVILNAALEVTAKQGFNVDTVDPKGRVLAVSKEIQNDEDKEISHTIKSTVTVVNSGTDESLVLLSANQVTELHKKSYVWWHLLWVLPLIPIDTEYTTVVTDRNTIHEPEFYSSFFSKLNQSVTIKNEKLAQEKIKIERAAALEKYQKETAAALQASVDADAQAIALVEQQIAAAAQAKPIKTKKSRKN